MRGWTTLAIAALAATTAALPARAHDPELEMKMMLEAKLKRPFVKAAGFTTDFDAAVEAARKSEKPIFAYFTISYNQVPACDEVEKEVLSSEAFRKFGEGTVLFLHVTSGLEGKHSDLLREKGGGGVPAFMVLDADGNVLAKAPSPYDVAGFERTLKSGLEYGTLRKKADKTADEKVQVLARDMDLGNLKLLRAQEKVAALGETTAAQKKVIDEAMLRLEIWTAATGAGDSMERTLAAGKKFAGMWAAGREPTTDDHVDAFFRFILDHAEEVRDAGLFRKALEKLRARFSGKPGWEGFDKWQSKRLAAIEELGAGDGKKAPPADEK